MTAPEKFEQVAARYDRLAQQATTESVRKHLRKIAEQNHAVADRLAAVLAEAQTAADAEET
jgi:hypothetical protein